MGVRRSRRKALPEVATRATIESLAHDGRGIAYIDGKAVFVDEALPGEEIEFVYTDMRRDYAEGKLVKLLSASAHRVKPRCDHYGVCGGCSFQHVEDSQQIRIKEDLLGQQLARIGKVQLPALWEPLTGPHWAYRCKARMGVKYVAKKNRVLVGFRERRHPYLAEIDSCPVMHPKVGQRLLDLSAMIGALSIRDKIPQIEVAVGDDECVLAFRVLTPPTPADCRIMRDFGREHDISICLQSKGPDTIAPLPGEPEIVPEYRLPERQVRFQFKPAMFTQVNYAINRSMVDRAIAALHLNEHDRVLDLFCGLGNFSLPMAKVAGHVTGIDGDLPLIQHARHNARLNALHNVDFYAADLSANLDDYPWSKTQYDKILLDPSRAGAADVLPYFARWNPQIIVYVSCNPSTLARDTGILVHDLGYRLLQAGVMDMFPQTAHVESIALFVR